MTIEPKEIALEEWKQAGSIVNHQEDMIFKLRAWLFTLVTGISVVLYSQNNTLQPLAYLILCILVILLFLLLEVFLTIPLRKAISRARYIEKALQEKMVYDGFRLSESMGETTSAKSYFDVLRRTRVWLLYAALILIAIVFSLTALKSGPICQGDLYKKNNVKETFTLDGFKIRWSIVRPIDHRHKPKSHEPVGEINEDNSHK